VLFLWLHRSYAVSFGFHTTILVAEHPYECHYEDVKYTYTSRESSIKLRQSHTYLPYYLPFKLSPYIKGMQRPLPFQTTEQRNFKKQLYLQPPPAQLLQNLNTSEHHSAFYKVVCVQTHVNV